jgi:hypothetical protein
MTVIDILLKEEVSRCNAKFNGSTGDSIDGKVIW